jgi:hypothetical protein
VRSIIDGQGRDIRVVSLYIPENPTPYIQVGRPMADYVSLERQLRFILLYVGLIGIIFVITKIPLTIILIMAINIASALPRHYIPSSIQREKSGSPRRVIIFRSLWSSF